MKPVNWRTSTLRPVVQRTMQKDLSLRRRSFTQSDVEDPADGQPRGHPIILDAAPPDIATVPPGRNKWVTSVTSAKAGDLACLYEPLPTVPSPRGSRIVPMTAETWVSLILTLALRHPQISRGIVSGASSRST